MDPRGAIGMGGLGDYTLANGAACDPGIMGPALCQDSTVRILNAITAGAVAGTQQLTGPSSYASCPAGQIFNPQTLMSQPGVAINAQASGNGFCSADRGSGSISYVEAI
jgi:hypothetical protein